MRMTAPPFTYVIPSKAFAMSFLFSTGWRILRAEISVSCASALTRIRVLCGSAPLRLPTLEDLGRGPGRERFIQPGVVPPRHRHQVAEPLMAQLVCRDAGVAPFARRCL